MPPKLPRTELKPKERTLEVIQEEIRRLTQALTGSTENAKYDPKELSDLGDFPDIKEAFHSGVFQTREDCVVLIRTKLEILLDEFKCLKEEILGVEEEIKRLVTLFFLSQMEVENNQAQQINFRARKKKKERFGVREELDNMKKGGEIEKAKRRREQIRIQFDDKIIHLKKICPESKQLKDQEVIRLTVLLAKSERTNGK